MIRTAEEFGALVRERRKAMGLTQVELAERCGVSHVFVRELEHGKPTTQLGKALTAAVEVGLELGDLAALRATREPADPDEPDDELGHLPSF